MHIMRELRGRTTGFAIPDYVLDTPYGKVPLNRTYVHGRAGDRVVMETYDGTIWAEPNPLPANEAVPYSLPSVPMPAEAKTVDTNDPERPPFSDPAASAPFASEVPEVHGCQP
jgi:lysine 2,3-aminomutase